MSKIVPLCVVVAALTLQDTPSGNDDDESSYSTMNGSSASMNVLSIKGKKIVALLVVINDKSSLVVVAPLMISSLSIVSDMFIL